MQGCQLSVTKNREVMEVNLLTSILWLICLLLITIIEGLGQATESHCMELHYKITLRSCTLSSVAISWLKSDSLHGVLPRVGYSSGNWTMSSTPTSIFLSTMNNTLRISELDSMHGR